MSMTTLETVIVREINLGQKDPHAIYDRLLAQMGDELIELAKPHMADFISNYARQRLNSQRRSSIAKIKPGDVDPEIKLRSLWVPSSEGIIYKRISDMTADDFDARAEYLEHLARSISRHAQWCRDVALAMREQNAETARDLDQLPSLADGD